MVLCTHLCQSQLAHHLCTDSGNSWHPIGFDYVPTPLKVSSSSFFKLSFFSEQMFTHKLLVTPFYCLPLTPSLLITSLACGQVVFWISLLYSDLKSWEQNSYMGLLHSIIRAELEMFWLSQCSWRVQLLRWTNLVYSLIQRKDQWGQKSLKEKFGGSCKRRVFRHAAVSSG